MKTALNSLRIAGGLGILLFCAGCLVVDDLGGQWEKAAIDPALEGAWECPADDPQSEDSYMTFTKKKDYYAMDFPQVDPKSDGGPTEYVRTLKIGDGNFLIIDSAPDEPRKEGSPQAGFLLRYALKDGKLTIYMLKDDVLDAAIKRGAIKGTIPKQDNRKIKKPSTISILDGPTLDFLAGLVKKRECWQVLPAYERVENLDKAMKKSRARRTPTPAPGNGNLLK